MRILQWSIASLGLIAAIGCAERAPDPVPERPRTGATTETRGAPAWIDNEDSIPGKLGAVGIAQPNALNDRSMQRSMALADARTKLAAKLTVNIEANASTASVATNSATVEGKNRNSSSSAAQLSVQTSRQRTEARLTGAQPWQWWTDPKDGALYVLLVVDKETP